jgi:hypothetical protein
MTLKIWRFLTIMLTAGALSAALAHAMELPGKLNYESRLYVLLHRTLYPTFGHTAGWAEGLAAAERVAALGSSGPLAYAWGCHHVFNLQVICVRAVWPRHR